MVAQPKEHYPLTISLFEKSFFDKEARQLITHYPKPQNFLCFPPLFSLFITTTKHNRSNHVSS